jgi:UDP-glucuronate 4-epimerase
MPHYLVTGGAGFIGSHLSEQLLQRGDSLVCLDDFNDFYAPEIKYQNLKILSAYKKFSSVEGDIRDRAMIERIFQEQRFDGVIHLAARAGVRPSLEDPALYGDVNILATTYLLEAARAHGVARFIFASSSSVYGGNTDLPFAESHPVPNPESPYAATKRAAELLCKTYHHLYAKGDRFSSMVCLRFFTVYGPRQRPEMAISKFTTLLLAGEKIPMFGDGSTARDYTYVDDIVDGIIRALDRATGFRIYNLGGEDPVRLDHLIRIIGEAAGVTPEIEPLPLQPGDVTITSANCSLARAEIGYAPRVHLPEGIKGYLEWHRANRC